MMAKSTVTETDLNFIVMEDLSWASQERTISLEKVFKYVSSEAQRAIAWYLSKKKSKRIWARSLRLTAIVATTFAGLIPLLSQIFTSKGIPNISPAWASVALLVAAAHVGLDKFFGFSSAWIRFLTTELQIRSALQEFQLDWEIQKANLKGTDPNDEQVQGMLSRCKTFLSQINIILNNEMMAWKQEFQSALKHIDDAAKAQAAVVMLGGANVVVNNGDKCNDGWKLSIDGGSQRLYRGQTAALQDLTSGIHTIRVEGKVGDKIVQAENAFQISPGSTARIELEMI
ncbi:MAG: SLATT domain-containing protein [Candidatus Scalindua sp.]|nr:SLATT domain-containing protein [Candidatus Scalindua sp.]